MNDIIETLSWMVNEEDWHFSGAALRTLADIAGIPAQDPAEIVAALVSRSRGLDGAGWAARSDEELAGVANFLNQ